MCSLAQWCCSSCPFIFLSGLTRNISFVHISDIHLKSLFIAQLQSISTLLAFILPATHASNYRPYLLSRHTVIQRLKKKNCKQNYLFNKLFLYFYSLSLLNHTLSCNIFCIRAWNNIWKINCIFWWPLKYIYLSIITSIMQRSVAASKEKNRRDRHV